MLLLSLFLINQAYSHDDIEKKQQQINQLELLESGLIPYQKEVVQS